MIEWHDIFICKMQEVKEETKTDQVLEAEEENRGKIDFITPIREIGKIMEQAGGLSDLFFDFARPHLELLCDHLRISQTAAALFASLVNIYDGTIPRHEFAEYLKCDLIEVYLYLDELEVLEQRGLIHIVRDNEDFRKFVTNKLSFELRVAAIDALRKGSFKGLFFPKNLSIEDFFIQLESLCEGRIQRRQSYGNTIKTMQALLKDNEHLVFVQKIQSLSLSGDDALILLRFFHYQVNLDEPEMGFDHLEALYDCSSDFTRHRQLLRNGDHVLLAKGLIQYTYSDGFGDPGKFRLTDSVTEEFLVELDMASKIPPKWLITHSTIAEKELFYPEKTRRAIDELCSLLEHGHFSNIQKRLSDNNMRTGFACIFSGSPGTGKTETVYQIARLIQRDIMHVDISDTKSPWFGDSERRIKAVFDKYRNCVKKCEHTPILLFNEADAVFGKRRLIGENHSGPAQTENAIQNILLNEIENLNGILIATTNLTKNFDPAFERRFLYKIEFEKPEAETRKAIWRSLIAGLSDEDAGVLALRFDFSGGQIENISRKSTVHKVLSGDVPVLEDLVKFCNEECSGKDGEKRIGFHG